MSQKKSIYEVKIIVTDDDVPPKESNFFWSYLAITIASVVLVNTCILMPLVNGINSFTLLDVILCSLMSALIVHQVYVIFILKKKHKTDLEWYAMSKAILAFSEQFQMQREKFDELSAQYARMNSTTKQEVGDKNEGQD